MTESVRYWLVRVYEGIAWYLDWPTGTALQAELEARKQDERGSDQKQFWSGEDITGEPLTLRYDFIISCHASTPEGRAREEDPDGPLEAIRRLSIHRAGNFKWGAEGVEEL